MHAQRNVQLFLAATAMVAMSTLVVLGGGCSFDTAASGLECDEEGASRPGEVCRDGYWRIDPDASNNNVHDSTDQPDGADDDADPPGDADVRMDTDGGDGACQTPDERELCEQQGMPCGEISAPNPCAAGGLTVDCTQFIDFDSDPQHCGGCDQACAQPGPNAEATCEDSSCGLQCDPGYVDANGDIADGCEQECSPSNGGVEICDGRDNDCDGQIDEDAEDAQTYYRDADGDGYGTPDESTQACDQPDGFVANAGDCDDTDADVHPNQDEVCDGSVDDNCDGNVDEDCPCTNGETRECGSSVGACQTGTQTCTDGQWEAECSGEVGPEPELCDDIDNDCDGDVDEDFADKGNSCSAGTGACEQGGVLVCTADGSGTECNATASDPADSETCGDGIDNTCDGVIDENCPCDYDASTDGVCATATRDSSGTCQEPDDYEVDESLCDGLDNDCDGAIDEGCPCDYGTSEGVCGDATLDDSGNCQEPDGYEPSEMTCDGLDNDCDGTVDEGMRSVRYLDADGDGYGDPDTATSVCPSTPGYVDDNTDCDDTNPWTHPDAPEICDGRDNNCNGWQVDNRGTDASRWCRNRYASSDYGMACDNDGPGGTLCCETDSDTDGTCDFETVCDNGIDEDQDGLTDCADPDCDGLYCDPGMVCQNSTCQPI